MTTTPSATTAFVAYEYQTVPVSRDKQSLYSDVYRSFGWIPDGQSASTRPGSLHLRFKRDRRLPARPVLAELQHRCEAALHSIDTLERSRTVAASIVAMLIGLLGAALLAGSVFSLEASFVTASIVLGATGLAICIPPYFVFTRMRAARTKRISSDLDREFDIVYNTAEQAARLLAPTPVARP